MKKDRQYNHQMEKATMTNKQRSRKPKIDQHEIKSSEGELMYTDRVIIFCYTRGIRRVINVKYSTIIHLL